MALGRSFFTSLKGQVMTEREADTVGAPSMGAWATLSERFSNTIPAELHAKQGCDEGPMADVDPEDIGTSDTATFFWEIKAARSG